MSASSKQEAPLQAALSRAVVENHFDLLADAILVSPSMSRETIHSMVLNAVQKGGFHIDLFGTATWSIPLAERLSMVLEYKADNVRARARQNLDLATRLTPVLDLIGKSLANEPSRASKLFNVERLNAEIAEFDARFANRDESGMQRLIEENGIPFTDAFCYMFEYKASGREVQAAWEWALELKEHMEPSVANEWLAYLRAMMKHDDQAVGSCIGKNSPELIPPFWPDARLVALALHVLHDQVCDCN